MNYDAIKQLKQSYDELHRIFIMLDEDVLFDRPVVNMSMEKILLYDLARFFMYLSASDGRLYDSEAEVYRTVTGFNDSIDSIIDTINREKIYSTAFESTVPASMILAVKAQYRLLSMNQAPESQTLPEMLFDLFEFAGEVMVRSDGNVSYEEKRDYFIYLDTLRDYMRAKGF